MRNIILHGRLKDRFGQVYRLDVATAGEAVRALGINVPGFLEELKEGSYEVVRGDYETGLRLGEEDVNSFKLGQGDLHIVPVIAGSKNQGGFLKIILGVALVGAAIFMGPVLGAGFAAPVFGGSSITWGNVAIFGAILALSGVSQLLTNPEKKKEDKKDESFTLAGPRNFYDQGMPVPLIYGEVITGGVAISGGLDIEDIGAYKG